MVKCDMHPRQRKIYEQTGIELRNINNLRCFNIVNGKRESDVLRDEPNVTGAYVDEDTSEKNCIAIVTNITHVSETAQKS